MSSMWRQLKWMISCWNPKRYTAFTCTVLVALSLLILHHFLDYFILALPTTPYFPHRSSFNIISTFTTRTSKSCCPPTTPTRSFPSPPSWTRRYPTDSPPSTFTTKQKTVEISSGTHSKVTGRPWYLATLLHESWWGVLRKSPVSE